jgi:hypothetical protein
MNPMPELIPMLKQLRLSGIMDSIETRNRQAIEDKMSCLDSLPFITDEIERWAHITSEIGLFLSSLGILMYEANE